MISVTGSTVDEDSGRVNFTIRLSKAVQGSIVYVNVVTSDGTANSGSDYTHVSRRVSIAANYLSASVSVPITDDTIDEPNETFTLTLSNPSRATLSSTPYAQATIRDDDDSPPGAVLNLSVNCSTVEDDGEITVTWQQGAGTPPTGFQVEAEYRSYHWSINPRAFARTNVGATAQAHTFTGIIEGWGTYRILVTAYVADLGGVPAVVDCQPPLPVVSMSDEKLTVGEGNSVQVTAILDSMPNGTAAVWFAVSGGSGSTSSCSGVDFIVDQSRFVFTNTTTASITLTACDDTDTDDETVSLSFATIGITGLELGSPATVEVSISDDDVAVSFERTAYSVDEGDVGTIRVQLNRAPGRTVTIPITTTDQSGATSSDYSGVPTGITFLSGDTSRIIFFAATRDDINDDNESVRLGFGTLPAGVFAGAARHATVSINDADGTIIPPPLPVVSLSSGRLTVNESMSVTVSASLDRAPGGTASVQIEPSGATNGNGSCSAEADFYVDDTEFTFTSTTSASVTLHACDDTDTNNENVTLSLTTFGITGLQLGSPIRVVVRITDDDIVDGYGL